MKGRYYANIFIHFEPTGRPLDYNGDDFVDRAVDNSLPPYILPNSPQTEEWMKRNPSGWHMVSPSAAHVDISKVHEAAAALATAKRDVVQDLGWYQLEFQKMILQHQNQQAHVTAHEVAFQERSQEIQTLQQQVLAGCIKAKEAHDRQMCFGE